ncbi:hypothetical protein SmJEL517_g03409 [Synchytrium microbalum]|uniref:Uncharacterized protein n=1 Tax=Synchytrium microbalum TaxID=1806994 RepID=A0A507C6P1_9FUNG|nr:uncharacterized protein SmJEL517_g03409 [Synchytrium microbalum]TPX33724.1 hypothetical protein SmJEL517_g03409 [Synchytrium microbalum]
MAANPADDDNILLAKVENVRSVVTLLKAISFKNKTICEINDQGLKFTTEEAHCAQAHAYLKSRLFDEYHYTPDQDETRTIFALDLEDMIECLTIFGGSSLVPFATNKDGSTTGVGAGSGGGNALYGNRVKENNVTSLRMSFKRSREELTLMLEDGGVLTVCRLPTSDAESNLEMDQEFRNQPLVSKVIVASEWLKNSFHETDRTAEYVSLLISPDAPYFRISAMSAPGETQMDYPKTSDVIEAFQSDATQLFKYKYQMLEPSFKALASSTKTALKINQIGLLHMQFLIPTSETDTCFVEYLASS